VKKRALFQESTLMPRAPHEGVFKLGRGCGCGTRVYGKDGTHCFVVLGPYDGMPATVGNGSMFGFRLDTWEKVDASHARALALGGADEGAPGERAPKFYMSYFRDLDGNTLCGNCMA